MQRERGVKILEQDGVEALDAVSTCTTLLSPIFCEDRASEEADKCVSSPGARTIVSRSIGPHLSLFHLLFVIAFTTSLDHLLPSHG
jgi:hypothetical protein